MAIWGNSTFCTQKNFNWCQSGIGQMLNFVHFLVVVQLIYRPRRTNISCTTIWKIPTLRIWLSPAGKTTFSWHWEGSMYYLSPLSISFASEETLKARIELRRPKLALCDDVNLEDSVTPPETEMGIIFCTCTSGKLRYSLLTIVIEAVQCGPSSGGTQSVDIRLKVPPQCKLLLFQTLKFKVNKSLSCTPDWPPCTWPIDPTFEIPEPWRLHYMAASFHLDYMSGNEKYSENRIWGKITYHVSFNSQLQVFIRKYSKMVSCCDKSLSVTLSDQGCSRYRNVDLATPRPTQSRCCSTHTKFR